MCIPCVLRLAYDGFLVLILIFLLLLLGEACLEQSEISNELGGILQNVFQL